MGALITRLFMLGSISTLVLGACEEGDDALPTPTVVKEWTIPISTNFENPNPPGRTESGTAELQLLSDNTFNWSVNVNGLATGDILQAGHLHTGNPAVNGPVILNLNPTFTGGTASGSVMVPRQTLVDSILNTDVYINLHSDQFKGGLVRGQLNKTIDFSMDVELNGDEEVPAVNTTATGLAWLRLATDKTLYYRINVADLEAGDALTAAHIHAGAAGVSGDVVIPLAAGPADFGVAKSLMLTDAQFNALKNDQVYLNVHSTNHGDGVIRGQIR